MVPTTKPSPLAVHQHSRSPQHAKHECAPTNTGSPLLCTADSPCKVRVRLTGLEVFVYNNSTAYDRLQNLVEKHKPHGMVRGFPLSLTHTARNLLLLTLREHAAALSV